MPLSSPFSPRGLTSQETCLHSHSQRTVATSLSSGQEVTLTTSDTYHQVRARTGEETFNLISPEPNLMGTFNAGLPKFPWVFQRTNHEEKTKQTTESSLFVQVRLFKGTPGMILDDDFGWHWWPVPDGYQLPIFEEDSRPVSVVPAWMWPRLYRV